MQVVLDGEAVDIFDDERLWAKAHERSNRMLDGIEVKDTQDAAVVYAEHLSNITAALTVIAVKFGALAYFHGVRRDIPVDVDHLQEIASILQQSVGLVYTPPAEEQGIVVPDTANEGEDIGTHEEG